MTRLQTIIEGIDHLDRDELALLFKELKKRLDHQKKAEAILVEFIGSGKGVWQTDAQTHVDELRNEEG